MTTTDLRILTSVTETLKAGGIWRTADYDSGISLEKQEAVNTIFNEVVQKCNAIGLQVKMDVRVFPLKEEEAVSIETEMDKLLKALAEEGLLDEEDVAAIQAEQSQHQ